MPKVHTGKSHMWYERHCAICKKKFENGEKKIKSHAVFDDNEELHFLACEQCVTENSGNIK